MSHLREPFAYGPEGVLRNHTCPVHGAERCHSMSNFNLWLSGVLLKQKKWKHSCLRSYLLEGKKVIWKEQIEIPADLPPIGVQLKSSARYSLKVSWPLYLTFAICSPLAVYGATSFAGILGTLVKYPVEVTPALEKGTVQFLLTSALVAPSFALFIGAVIVLIVANGLFTDDRQQNLLKLRVQVLEDQVAVLEKVKMTPQGGSS